MKNVFSFLLLCGIIPFGFSQQNNYYTNITQAKNGFVGINITTPDAMISVKGSIHTQEVNVDLNGALSLIYLFENDFIGASDLNTDYDFISLIEIEFFIINNNHLLKVPSASDMYENVMSLIAM